MRRLVRHTVPARAALLAVALVLLLPTVALAHAELDTSSPADGDSVEGSPTEITADFTESLVDGSSFELLDAGGSVVAEGRIDPDDDQRMTIDPPELEPGEYEVRWQARAEDGHLERGTYGFTVTAASTPPPTPSAPPSAAPTETVAPSEPTSPSPSAAPTPTPDTEPTASTSDVLLPIIVAVVLLAVLAGYLLNRRRATPRP
jgi:methionine-rich copper-binding protein CopC